jgi:hypothetical protein
MIHSFPCGCFLCGSFAVACTDTSGPDAITTDDVARLLSDVATLAKMDAPLYRRVNEMLRQFVREEP